VFKQECPNVFAYCSGYFNLCDKKGDIISSSLGRFELFTISGLDPKALLIYSTKLGDIENNF
jgi:hypothetical protein